MSHENSTIIIRGNYDDETPLQPGQVRLELAYKPTAGLSEAQVNQNIAKLRRLADRAYHVESDSDE